MVLDFCNGFWPILLSSDLSTFITPFCGYHCNLVSFRLNRAMFQKKMMQLLGGGRKMFWRFRDFCFEDHNRASLLEHARVHNVIYNICGKNEKLLKSTKDVFDFIKLWFLECLCGHNRLIRKLLGLLQEKRWPWNEMKMFYIFYYLH